jgi:hypothetical protein
VCESNDLDIDNTYCSGMKVVLFKLIKSEEKRNIHPSNEQETMKVTEYNFVLLREKGVG